MTDLLHPGELAIEWKTQDIKGNLICLSDYHGKPIVLAFLRGFM